MTPLLEAREISIRLQGRQLLERVSLQVGQGEIVTLIGPNGAGKTTLVRIILGLLKADQGEVVVKPGVRIGYMPQQLALSENMPLRVERFLSLGADRSASDFATIVDELLIGKLLRQPMQRLSGGERQRVLLARALMRRPELLVLDEPVQGVDVTGQAALYSLITEIRERFGCGVLMISHDLHLVMATTDQVLCLNQHVCCSGHPESVSQHPAYLELFGAPASARLAVYTHHHDHTHDIHGDVETESEEHSHG
ncbi:MAG: zinc ABC transporter ATP-binding protein ZnuC [gamma proteobacterium symbiont of Ctena orbiculata]|uniref:Zinc ABC transporter ATP-binding protein ZnuC n=1 Tax=Candidatus Thiodiazotropha taylori TaxID=2792791 RepID=A0A944MBQ9_9GAMM|nr:zinc ABC transporter ATP-binding protein ZnuC [Candidatus Thiodiazotropha taylori]PUB88351.1 MAG: zinc ABC transporter ATP-binding protein ZnuC [gamma proteobacterium symbiont of Ctena orbiculata]MBT2988125.1 zinc ABC transporter ATP-binding protein ZnuC [Candidatus Thiodiazotropha taylori]MBT2998489.1 zinc ABC transporter ATP-binding protein ZnuC [Candidatus Thiodiazotropha taylori]MBT3002133.1 zinc ABC transporter ATP-binding protein ZnuC [Candidatus Thiodiazotropha taylori]